MTKLSKNLKTALSVILAAIMVMSMGALALTADAADASDARIDLGALTVTKDGETSEITTYAVKDYDKFLEAYKAGTLPEVYITGFVFDGAGMVYQYDLDQNTDGSYTVAEPELVETTCININMTGDIEFTGTAKKTMIAVNTNGVTKDINLILNNVTPSVQDVLEITGFVDILTIE